MWQSQQQQYVQQGTAPQPARMQQMQSIHMNHNHHQHHHHHHHRHQPVDNGMQFVQQQQQVVAPQQLQQQQQQCRMMNIAVNSSNPRASRNMAEKQRRDNLNTQIATMASLVPTVSNGGSRKKDKISVLRLTAAHLRVAYTLGLTNNEFLPKQFNDIDLESCLIDNLAGNSSFLLVVTTSGKIIYISRHVEQHLGHEQIDLIGDSLYNYVYSEDHEELTRGLKPSESCIIVELRGNSDSLEESSNSSEDSMTRIEYTNFKEQRRSFNIRMSQRTNSRRESVQYEYLQVSGVLRLANECRAKDRPRRENNSTSNDIIFVGTARLLKKRTITELSLLEASKSEYFTRHLTDGRIIFCDHRISVVAGYMSEEVSGTSAFKFMHKDDVKWTIVALKDMYDHGKNYGSSCYRLITKTGEFIYLRTHGYLEYDETSHSAVSFICINTLTSEKEGEELIAEMKKRFSATITNTTKGSRDDGFESESECSTASHGAPIMDDATQLEEALAQLLGDLPQPVIDDRSSPSPLPNTQLVKAAMYSQRLPPASIQASKIGIKDMENAYVSYGKGGKGGKNGKGKQKPAAIENGSNDHVQNNNKGVKKVYGEKRMPELEKCSSPTAISTSRASVPIAEKAFPLANENEELESDLPIATTLEFPPLSKSDYVQPPTVPSPFDMKTFIETYNEGPTIKSKNDSSFSQSLPPSTLSQQQQPLRQQTNLKRPYDQLEDTNSINPKKRPGNNGDNVDLVNISDNVLCTNDYSVYVPVQPMTLNTDLQEVPSDFKQLDANTISIALTDDQFIDFQDLPDDQLLNSAIENNPEIIKLFSNLPPTINLDETIDDPNEHQYPISGQCAVVENNVKRTHLKLADSMSSCESQFSDIEKSNIATQCNSFTPTHNDHNNEKQQLTGLQRKSQHDIGV